MRSMEILRFERFPYFFGFFKSILNKFTFINKGSQGRKNLEIMNMLGFGPSNHKIDNLLNQHGAE